jgi:hypothetical protein
MIKCILMKMIARITALVACLGLGGCHEIMVAPAIKTETQADVRLTGREKFVVLPFKVTGYPPEEITHMSQRLGDLVELALQRQGLPIIPRISIEKKLEQLQFQPPDDLDIPSALLMHRLAGADIVVEGIAQTATVEVLNSFQETIYAIDAKSGNLLLTTHASGDSDIYSDAAQDLVDKIRQTIH